MPDLAQQIGEVAVEVAGVGPAWNGVAVEAHRGSAPARDLPSHLKRLEHAESPRAELTESGPHGEVQDRGTSKLCRGLHEVCFLDAFEMMVPPPAPLSYSAELPEQHRLADPAESYEQLAAVGASTQQALSSHIELLPFDVPADQGRRGTARPGAVGIGQRVQHGSLLQQSTPRESSKIYLRIADCPIRRYTRL